MQFPHVFLEVKVSTKAFATDLAGEWFLVIVCVHMECQIIDLMKRFIAYVALVRFLAAMCELVVLIVTLLMKTLATKFANKRFEIGMYTCMGIESRTTIEGFAACNALVRLFSSVDDFMSAKSAGLTETFTTNLADKWSGARMHWHMSS